MFNPLNTKYLASPQALLRALLKAKTLKRVERRTDAPPATMRSSIEDVSPFTLREGLFYELG